MLWSIYGTVNSAESGEFTGAVKYPVLLHMGYSTRKSTSTARSGGSSAPQKLEKIATYSYIIYPTYISTIS